MNPDKIIQEIVQAFNTLDDIDTSKWNLTQWSSEVLTALCRVGRENDYYVYADSRFVDEQNKDGGEWLYDVIWCKYDENNFLKSVPVVAECEWDPLPKIKDDFEKLPLARAAVRVMVFNGMHCKNGAEAIANKLCSWVGAFEGSRKGDTYLLVGYERDENNNWYSRYFKILINDSGQQPVLKGL